MVVREPDIHAESSKIAVTEASSCLCQQNTDSNLRRRIRATEYLSILNRAQITIRQLNLEIRLSRDLIQRLQLPQIEVRPLQRKLRELLPSPIPAILSDWLYRFNMTLAKSADVAGGFLKRLQGLLDGTM